MQSIYMCVCVCVATISIVKCGQDCSRSEPLYNCANRTCAFVQIAGVHLYTTHFYVLCQRYLCAVSFSIVQSPATTAVVSPCFVFCPMHWSRHSIAHTCNFSWLDHTTGEWNLSTQKKWIRNVSLCVGGAV